MKKHAELSNKIKNMKIFSDTTLEIGPYSKKYENKIIYMRRHTHIYK